MCPFVSSSFVFHMYWFTTMNVLNKQHLHKLTLKRTLLKMVVLGVFGAKDFEYRSWQLVSLLLFCLRSFKAWKIRREKTYIMQTFTNYHQWRVQALTIPTILSIYSLWGFFSPVCSDFARNIDGSNDHFLHN